MRKHLPVVLAFVIIVASGAAHGVITRRWTQSDALQQAVDRLAKLPTKIGDWKIDQELTIPPRQLERGEIDGFRSRSYVNQTNGNVVNVIIVCGRAGPISVHTPDVCFRGQGLRLAEAQSRDEILSDDSGIADEFWRGDFIKPGFTTSAGLRVYWTWTTTGPWRAPDNPRWTFAGEPFLYKMYITSSLSGMGNDSADQDLLQEFIQAWMPVVRKSLFPNSG